MDTVSLKKEIIDIKLDDIFLERAQVRLTNVGKGISELADSIRKVGMLEPIVVCPSEDEGKFEIIAGQRRYLAHREIGAETIKAVVIDRQLNEVEAKVLSLTENLVRLDLPTKDLIDVCTFLYKKYGKIRLVAEATGLSANRIREFVKYDRLIPELKKEVDGGLDVKVALRAQDAASVTGEIKKEEAVKFAKAMGAMSGAQRKKLVKDREKDPEASVDKILESAKSGGKLTQIIVTLGPEAHQGLQKYSKEEEVNQDEAAATLIEEGLSGKGYIGTD